MSVKITSPVNGQKFLLKDAVTFTGTADSDVVRVELVADEKFSLVSATVENGSWSFSSPFHNAGKRQIIAKGFDKENNQVASDETVIFLRLPGSYTPPSNSISLLGEIAATLDAATAITQPLLGSEIILKLPDGQLYIEADMDIDSDGSPRAKQIDKFGQLETSLLHPGKTGQEKFVNSEEVPYFVLPGGFFKPLGIKLGDIAAVIHKGLIEYAVFADVGPSKKIGEGSIALAQSFGHDPFVNGKVKKGIPRNVIYIVFPGSGDGTPQTVEKVRDKGKQLFRELGGNPT